MVIIAILFLFLQRNKTHQVDNVVKEVDSVIKTTSAPTYKVAYINSDTVWEKYALVQKMKDELAAEKVRYEQQYSYEMKQLEKEVIDFQNQAQFLTMEQGRQKEAELMQKQQELMQMQESLNQRFMTSEKDKNQVVYDSIIKHINAYSKANNLHYVLGQNLSGAVFYGVDSLNITNEILSSLNTTYNTSTKK